MASIKITASNFENEVIKSEKTVLLDFWATWCGPCQMIAPVMEEIAEENPQIKVGKINVDEEMALAEAFGIESIPTLVVIKDGKALNKAIGFHSKQQILDMISAI